MSDYKTEIIRYVGIHKRWKPPCYGELWSIGKGPYILGCVQCGIPAVLKTHTIMIHLDIIDIGPSIVCPFCGAHYWVKNSKVC